MSEKIVDPKDCKLCKLSRRQPHTKIVTGVGNPHADLMFIGEAPGRTEAFKGEPFVGDAGDTFNELLGLAQINRQDVYISNVCKCWPWMYKENTRTGTKSLTNRQPEPDEIRACLKYLEAEIAAVDPKVIIPLGGTALSAIEGKKLKITERVGVPSLYGHKGSSSLYKRDVRTYVLPTYHPSFVRRNGGVSTKESKITVIASEVLQHLKSATEIAQNKALFEEHQYRIVDSREKLDKVVGLLKQRKVMAFDIETEGLGFKDKVLGIGIGIDVGVACYIPFLVRPFMGDGLVNFWEDKDITREEVLITLRDLFADKTVQKSAHNAKFDMRGLQADLGIVVEGLFWDSMCGAYLINENSSNALDILKNRYIDLLGYSDAWKRETNDGKNASNASLDTISNYCCGDCDATYRLTKDQLKEFKDKPNCTKLMQKFYVPIMEFVKDFEYVGVRYNVERAEEMKAEYKQKADAMKEDIIRYAGCKFNPDSTKELPKVLFNILKLKHKKRTAKDNVSTDAEVLEDLAKVHIVPKLILEYRHFNKMRSTYMERFIKEADENYRLHLSTNPVGTVTGRPSSKGLMNVPREVAIKSLFVAKEGYKLIQADLSQAEVRCFAHYANEDILKAAFEQEGIDVHCLVAAEVNGVPYDEFYSKYKAGDEKFSNLRQAAKGTVFGLLYGRGPKSIAEEYGMKHEDAVAFMNKFFGRFPNCKKWIDDTHELVRQTGEVQNIFGRVRHIPGIFSQDSDQVARAERQSVNSIIQSTASDITCLSLINIHQQLKRGELPANIVLTVYDSIIAETRDDHVDHVSKMLVDTMERPPTDNFSVKMKADIDVYQEWGKKLKEAA